MKLSMLNRFRDFLEKEVADKLEAAQVVEEEYEAARNKHGLLNMPNEILERSNKTLEELKEAVAALKELNDTDFR